MTDRELLELIKKDKNKGMEKLIELYSSLLYKIIWGVIFTAGTPEDAEECVADCFIAFYSHLSSVDLSKGSLKGYLGVIAKRRAISLLRQLKRTQEKLIPINDELFIKDEDIFIKAEEKEILLKAVSSLGEPDCTIIIRKFLFGETAKEISQKVNLSAEAVQKRTERAMVKLKAILKGVIC